MRISSVLTEGHLVLLFPQHNSRQTWLLWNREKNTKVVFQLDQPTTSNLDIMDGGSFETSRPYCLVEFSPSFLILFHLSNPGRFLVLSVTHLFDTFGVPESGKPDAVLFADLLRQQISVPPNFHPWPRDPSDSSVVCRNLWMPDRFRTVVHQAWVDNYTWITQMMMFQTHTGKLVPTTHPNPALDSNHPVAIPPLFEFPDAQMGPERVLGMHSQLKVAYHDKLFGPPAKLPLKLLGDGSQIEIKYQFIDYELDHHRLNPQYKQEVEELEGKVIADFSSVTSQEREKLGGARLDKSFDAESGRWLIMSATLPPSDQSALLGYLKFD